MLLGTIRDGGLCPCPRCTVLMTDTDKLGQVFDMKYRLTKARTYLGDIVAKARDYIYNLGYGLQSAFTERLLKPLSLTPTIVSFHNLICSYSYKALFRMYFHTNLELIHILCLLWIFCMSLNLGPGKIHLSTLSGFCMLLDLEAQ